MNALLREKWRSSPCWPWYGGGVPSGYGRWRKGYAHRHFYEFAVGPIPDGTEIDHLCRNRGCVNPAHLEPVTHAENMARSGPALATHCKNGHPFDAANTYKSATGRRACRACNAENARRYIARKAAS